MARGNVLLCHGLGGVRRVSVAEATVRKDCRVESTPAPRGPRGGGGKHPHGGAAGGWRGEGGKYGEPPRGDHRGEKKDPRNMKKIFILNWMQFAEAFLVHRDATCEATPHNLTGDRTAD